MKMITRFLKLAALLLLSVATVKADSGQTVSYALTGATDATFTVTLESAPQVKARVTTSWFSQATLWLMAPR